MELNMSDLMPAYDAFAPGSAEFDLTPAQEHEGANLSVRALTRLLRIDCPDDIWLARTVFALRRVREGEALMHAGDKFHSIYVVRSGCFKTVYTDFSGSEQVLGFPLCGDLMGADGIDSNHYCSTAISLDTSEVAVVPLNSLEHLVYECPKLEAMLYRVLSRELVRVQNMAWTRGTLGAEGRVAAFLLNLSTRLGALGYSRRAFNLRMTRQEIGSYLGLKLETVSRALSALNADGHIQVHQRSIDILDEDGLHRVIDPAAAAPAGEPRMRAASPACRKASASKRGGNSRTPHAPAPGWRQFAVV